MGRDLPDLKATRDSIRAGAGGNLGSRAHALEEAFFAKREHELLEELRRKVETAKTVDALARECGIEGRETLEALVACGIRRETLPALTLVPLVRIAWADGRLDPSEREDLCRQALVEHIARGSAAWALLEHWLATPPSSRLYEAWSAYLVELLRATPRALRGVVARELLSPSRTLVEQGARPPRFATDPESAERRVLRELERLVDDACSEMPHPEVAS